MNLSTDSVHNSGENGLGHSANPASTGHQRQLTILEAHAELVADAAEILDTLTSQLPAYHPLRVAAASRAKKRVSQLYAMAAALTGERNG